MISALIRKTIKSMFSKAGYELVPINSRGLGYISSANVLEACRKRGISVNDYLEELWGLRSHAFRIVEQLKPAQYITGDTANIVEIGAGTGIYTGWTLEHMNRLQLSYEIYETSKGWADYLGEQYPVSIKAADGYRLTESKDASADLILAHGVFVYTSFITTMSYLHEICRVAKDRAMVAFDIFDENSYPEGVIQEWIRRGELFPNVTPARFVTGLFESEGFTLIDNFRTDFGGGQSNYYVFIR